MGDPFVFETLKDDTPLVNGDRIRMRCRYSSPAAILEPARLKDKLNADPRWKVFRIDDTFKSRSIRDDVIPELVARGGKVTVQDVPKPDGFDIYLEVTKNPFPVLVLVGAVAAVLISIYTYASIREVQRGRLALKEASTAQVKTLAAIDEDRRAKGLPPLPPDAFTEAVKAPPAEEGFFGKLATPIGVAAGIVGLLWLGPKLIGGNK